jgi:hypothetical protein
MKGVIVHGVLLAVMLVYGYRTWTRDRSVEPTAGQVVVWDRAPADIQSVVFTSSRKTVKIERRGEGAGAYWWGTEIRTDKRMKPPTATGDAGVPATDAGVPAAAAGDAGVPPSKPLPEEEIITTTTQFPIGTPGEDLVKGVAAMRALRALPPITADSKKEYGLELGDTTLAIVFKDGTRTFVIGNKVSGGKERYVLEPDSGKAFVLSGAFIDPMESGASQLRPSEPKGFDPALLAAVEIKAGAKSRKATRITTKNEKGDQTKTWAPSPGSGKADQTLANFVDSIDRLRTSQYEPDLAIADLTPVVAATFQDAQGRTLSTLTIYKREKPGDLPTDGTADPTAPPPTVSEYFLVTEKTRVPGVVAKAAAERIEQDVATLLP